MLTVTKFWPDLWSQHSPETDSSDRLCRTNAHPSSDASVQPGTDDDGGKKRAEVRRSQIWSLMWFVYLYVMLCHCMSCHYVDIITVIQPLYLSYSSVGIRIVRVKELHYDLEDIIRDSWFCWYLSKDGNLCFFYCTLFRFTMLSCCQRQNDQPQIKFT